MTEIGQFYGWERPLHFARQKSDAKPTLCRPGFFNKIKAEVRAAHEGVAIFDASPFGKIGVTGPDDEMSLLQACSGTRRGQIGAGGATVLWRRGAQGHHDAC